MKDFAVSFNYSDVDYTADIAIFKGHPSYPTYLHIKNVTPDIKGLPEITYVFYRPELQNFEHFEYNGTSDLSAIIFEAIKKYCKEFGISLIS